MTFLRWGLVALLTTMLAACTTAYQPYQAFGTGGYKERKLEEGIYIVSFFGNGNTGEQQVWNFWMYRCAELTLQNGYEFFVLKPSEVHAGLMVPGAVRPLAFEMLPDPSGTDGYLPAYYYTTYTTVTTYSSKAVVAMYKNPVPEKVGFLLDARLITDTLRPYVTSHARMAPPERKDLMVRAAVEAAIRTNRIKIEEAAKATEILQKGF